MQHDELAFFRAVNWARDGQPLTVPAYTLGDTLTATAATAAPTLWVLTQAVPDYAMLAYMPQLCSDDQLKLFCKAHNVTAVSNVQPTPSLAGTARAPTGWRTLCNNY